MGDPRHAERAVLIVISGLPGTGKTTVAERVARRVGAAHLSIDPVEDALMGAGFPPGWQTGVAAYEAVRAMAELTLRTGTSVVVDAVNDSEPARETWSRAAAAAGAEVRWFVITVADETTHARRLADRVRDFAHLAEPTWEQVQRLRRESAPWPDAVPRIETAERDVAGIVDEIAHALGAGSEG